MKRYKEFCEKMKRIANLRPMDNKNYRKGTHHTEETKKKMRLARLGYKQTKEARKKISEARKGKKLSKEHRDKLKGRIPWNKGKKMSVETRNKVSNSLLGKKGELSRNWKGGITPINVIIRESKEMKLLVKERLKIDNYTCQICNKKGGNLEVDHIRQFAYYPELRFEMSNLRTLCRKCHRKTDTYGNSKTAIRKAVANGIELAGVRYYEEQVPINTR